MNLLANAHQHTLYKFCSYTWKTPHLTVSWGVCRPNWICLLQAEEVVYPSVNVGAQKEKGYTGQDSIPRTSSSAGWGLCTALCCTPVVQGLARARHQEGRLQEHQAVGQGAAWPGSAATGNNPHVLLGQAAPLLLVGGATGWLLDWLLKHAKLDRCGQQKIISRKDKGNRRNKTGKTR